MADKFRLRGGRARPSVVLLAVVLLAGLAVVLLTASPRAHGQGLVCSAFGGGPPYAFETYESSRDRLPYLTAQRLAALNQLLPADPTFGLQTLDVGPTESRRPDPAATIPPELLHAIGWVESRLNQAAIEVPYDSTGPVLISASCAYGLMQVASFFTNEDDLPSAAEALTGAHYAYNIAMGAQILADKWNLDFFPRSGASDPSRLESWYYATWGYNGWAFVNHPAGSEVNPFRQTPYDCKGPFNGYPYQELVWGCLVNPPSVDGVQLWAAQPVVLPDLAVLAAPGGPLNPNVYFEGWGTVFSAPFGGLNGGRPFAAMDMPLPAGSAPLPAIPPDPDGAARRRAQILGLPALAVDETSVELTVTDEGASQSTITIRNLGRGLLVYRLVPDQPWILINVPAGIALGSDLVVREGGRREATIIVAPNPEGLAEGLHQGTIMVEALLPDGSVERQTVVVVVDKQGVPRYEAGRPVS